MIKSNYLTDLFLLTADVIKATSSLPSHFIFKLVFKCTKIRNLLKLLFQYKQDLHANSMHSQYIMILLTHTTILFQ